MALQSTLRTAVAGVRAVKQLAFPRSFSTAPIRNAIPIVEHFSALSIEPSSGATMSNDTTDIEEVHRLAVQEGSITYIDPSTGFTVFTELAHLRRGTCCGNQCRHCPFGWELVASGARRQAKLASGDFVTAKQLIDNVTIDSEADKPFISNGVKDSACNEEYSEQVSESLKGQGGRKGGKFTKKNVPYTRGGDKGTSQLLTGERRSKADEAFEAMGSVDELCTFVGVAHAELVAVENADELYGELPEWLLDVMSRLFDLGSHVAKPKKDADSVFDADGVGGGFAQTHIEQLEDWIDIMTEELPELVSFILPTGSKGAAQLQVARTVCRRAERRVVELVNSGVSDPNGMRYLNRLSDFFFTAARWVNFREGREEIQYRKEYRGAKQRTRHSVPLTGKSV